MSPPQKVDYKALDHPDICARIFHPRPELGQTARATGAENHLISMEQDIQVGAKFHLAAKEGPTILFFHGNGEIAADYDDVGLHFKGMSINFLVADYRGYGRSGGTPTISTMMSDCHAIFKYVVQWLNGNGYSGPLMVMGRSLGSASALELATVFPSKIAALIIESGFAFTEPLLQLLGIDTQAIGFEESTSFGNLFKMASYQGPTLIIHAEYDNLIPYSDGKALYDVCPAKSKRMLKIDNADHNDILIRGWDDYFSAIRDFAASIKQT